MKRQPRLSPRSTKALRTVSIIGTGSYVPEKILTNVDLSRMVDTSDDWITTRTGIKERRIAAKGEDTSDMATKAALKAMEQAKISPKEIDLIIVATATPDMLFPATACFVQKKIGATNAACLDISAATPSTQTFCSCRAAVRGALSRGKMSICIWQRST